MILSDTALINAACKLFSGTSRYLDSVPLYEIELVFGLSFHNSPFKALKNKSLELEKWQALILYSTGAP